MIDHDRAVDRIALRYQGRWLQGYARGKLRGDPIYAAAWERLKDAPLPVLDVGCGIGLLAFYLRERGFTEAVAGVDFDSGKIAQAERIAAAHCTGVSFAVAEVTRPLPEGPLGHVVISDVLHYLGATEQQALLQQAVRQVAPGGLCVIRETPRDESWRFRATQAEEWFIRAITWMKSGAVYFPTKEEVTEPFARSGFTVEVRPLWGGTPFNSHLFIFRAPG